MSEPKLISPMLDNFLMGEPYSDHHGVRCCPAMHKDTEEKYIVKIISIPASQVQLDALLLTGAYPDRESAKVYFKTLADETIEETKLLEKFSQLEGFIHYESCQLVEMEDGTGYEVYLLTSYKKTVEHIFRKGVVTHLAALNLGLDMCAALAVSRRSGYLYADLKPDNIFVGDDKEFRIGDIGFLPLNSLKYASLPDKYRSEYTAPEITDAYSSLNTTLDIYAAGMILYQAYNGGILPVLADGEALPAPAYADYEISEIILKACAANPEDRWQDPVQMGQALVSYMQRNGANDTPITPVAVPQDEIPELTSEVEEEDGAFLEDTPSEAEGLSEEITSEDAAEPEPSDFAEPEDISQEIPEEISEEDIFTEDAQGNLTFIDDSTDDTAAEDPESETVSEEADYEAVTDEVSQMLSQADDLISQEVPEPVVAPEPIEIKLPEPIEETETAAVDETSAAEEEPQLLVDEVIAEFTETVEDSESDSDVALPVLAVEKKPSHLVRNLIIGAAALLLLAGWLFYRNYYLQPISIVLEQGDGGILTVLVDSKIDEDKLSVICTDTYGIQHISPVENGKATFDELVPNSAYTVEVTIKGFHQLVGKTSTGYTTPTQTNILQFVAVTGPEDGSVILNFSIDGPDSQQWIVQYADDNETIQEVVFTNHMVTITGLTVGKSYDFTLLPFDDLQITGTNQLTHTASKLICASDFAIDTFRDGKLTVSWSAPSDASVASWTLRCYNDSGYDKTLVVQECSATFEQIDHTCGYTIELTAAGMSVCQRLQISKNAITVTDLALLASTPGTLTLGWNSSSAVDSLGWLLTYTVNGGEVQEISGIMENTVTVPAIVPDGNYEFTLRTVSGCTVLDGEFSCVAPPAEEFDAYGITADDMDFYMCRTPETMPWDADDINRTDYVTNFAVGERASFLIRLQDEPDAADEPLYVMFMIKDASGNTLSTVTSTYNWSTFWNNYQGGIDLPWLPDTAGTYWIGIYFNGMLAFDLDFTIN